MSYDARFEEIDKAALRASLLRLHTCPNCRGDLEPLAKRFKDVWHCHECYEQWHVPTPDTWKSTLTRYAEKRKAGSKS